jgi:chromate transporter
MIYFQLFVSYLKIGFFGFGGGYAMLSLIQNEVVEQHGWLTAEEFTDIVAISQIAPGPIAVNSATYVGWAVTGTVWGSLVAAFAVCLPAMTLMLLAVRFYAGLRGNRFVAGAMEGMKPMVVGMIMVAVLLLLTPATFVDWKSWAIFGVCVGISMWKSRPLLLLALSALAGLLLYT